MHMVITCGLNRQVIVPRPKRPANPQNMGRKAPEGGDFRGNPSDRLEISGPDTAQKIGMAEPKMGILTEVREPERF